MTITYSTGDLAESMPSASPLAGYLKKQWAALKARRERARVRSILYAMDERELKDLGFARSEIESVMVDASGDRVRAYPRPARSAQVGTVARQPQQSTALGDVR